mmetsp:Transcript_3366/g.5596  ORF Transcript_3366/g.5596 Transcript_3366/m.5596 type:complete len:202 (+) Transcript_3366:166-771(+)
MRQGRQFELDAHTLGPAMNAHLQLNDWTSALRLWDELVETGSLAPNGPCYAAAIWAYVGSGNWRRALALFDECKSDPAVMQGPSAQAYRGAIVACEHGSQWQYLLVLLDEMDRQNRSWLDTVVFSSAVRACSKAGQAASAIELVAEASRCGIELQVSAYRAALAILPSKEVEKARAIERAIEVAKGRRPAGGIAGGQPPLD